MIADCADVKVIKFYIHCNEVDTNMYDRLPIIYHTTEVSLCNFALVPEEGISPHLVSSEQEEKGKAWNTVFFLSHHKTCRRSCVGVCVGMESNKVDGRGVGDDEGLGSGCDSFKESEHVNQK